MYNFKFHIHCSVFLINMSFAWNGSDDFYTPCTMIFLFFICVCGGGGGGGAFALFINQSKWYLYGANLYTVISMS